MRYDDTSTVDAADPMLAFVEKFASVISRVVNAPLISSTDAGLLLPIPTRHPHASSIVMISSVPVAPSPFARNRNWVLLALLSLSMMKSIPLGVDIFAVFQKKSDGPEYELAPPFIPASDDTPIPRLGLAREKRRIFSALLVTNGTSKFEVVPRLWRLVVVFPPRDHLFINEFQSVIESAPVLPLLARARESPVHTRESPLFGATIERVPCLLLNVVQSVDLSSPVAVDEAYGILKV